MRKVQLNISVDEKTKSKLRYIAMQKERTMSGQANYVLHRFVQQFENENGKINVDDNLSSQ